MRNGNVDRAIRLLKRKLADDGLFKEIQMRKFYEKPSDKRRREKRAAQARNRRAIRDQIQ